MTEMALHEALNPISWLSGRWSTNDGKGEYPEIPNFTYHEDLEFVCIGQPMFNYSSSSRSAANQKPMHQERGFLRINPGTNKLALVVSHNSGITSLEEGRFDEHAKEIVLETVNLTRMSFAKPPKVTGMKRVIKLVAPNVLEIELFMETDVTPMTKHLTATYNKLEI